MLVVYNIGTGGPFTRTVNVTVFVSLKWVQCNPNVLFTHSVKNIKGAAHKNSDVEGMCKQDLNVWSPKL